MESLQSDSGIEFVNVAVDYLWGINKLELSAESSNFKLLEAVLIYGRREAEINWFDQKSKHWVKSIYSILCRDEAQNKARIFLMKILLEKQLQSDVCPFLCSIMVDSEANTRDFVQGLVLLKSFLNAMKGSKRLSNLQLLLIPLLISVLKGSKVR